MPIPVWNVGQVLAASDVNNWFIPVVAVKSVTELRVNNTTLANDTDLTIPVAAAATYRFDASFVYDGGAGGSETDFKWKFTMPAGSTIWWTDVSRFTDQVIRTNGHVTNDTATFGTAGLGAWIGSIISGTLITAGAAGSLTLQWAQGTSNGTRTDLAQGSYLYAQRIG